MQTHSIENVLTFCVISRILRCRETGLFQKWFHSALDALPKRQNQTIKQRFSENLLYSNPILERKQCQQVQSLSLSSLRSIFYFFVIGLMFSILVAVIETCTI